MLKCNLTLKRESAARLQSFLSQTALHACAARYTEVAVSAKGAAARLLEACEKGRTAGAVQVESS